MRFLKNLSTVLRRKKNKTSFLEYPTKKNDIVKYTYETNIFDEELQSFRILNGKYVSVIFSYTNVKFTEEKDGLRVSFNYKIHANPTNTPLNTQEFTDVLGDILMDVIEMNSKEKAFLNESDRRNDTEKSDIQ